MRGFAGIVVACLLTTAPLGAEQPEVIDGLAAALDNETLLIAGRRVRLLGTAAPTMDDWTYGVWARAGLDALLRSLGPLRCQVHERRSSGSVLAVCHGAHRGGARRDLGEWMIRAGYAVVPRDPADSRSMPDALATRYRAAEAAARAAGRGFWHGRAGY